MSLLLLCSAFALEFRKDTAHSLPCTPVHAAVVSEETRRGFRVKQQKKDVYYRHIRVSHSSCPFRHIVSRIPGSYTSQTTTGGKATRMYGTFYDRDENLFGLKMFSE